MGQRTLQGQNSADYLLAVKENQKELYCNIMDTFRFTPKEKLIQYQDVDIGHGRVETRVCTVTKELGQLSRVDDWKGINAFVRIESTRYIKATGICIL